MDIEKLIDAAAQAAVEGARDESITAPPFTFARAVALAARAGETDLASKLLVAARKAGQRGLTAPVEVEKRARYFQAQNGARVFREINQENGTNYPLPAWIRAEIGVTF